MKRLYTILSLTLVCALASAQNVTLVFQNAPLSEALRQIDQAQTEKRIHFVFDEVEDLRVTCDITNRPTEDAVLTVCQNLPVLVEARGRDIFVERAEERRKELSPILVGGSVRDAFLKEPLPGVRLTLQADDNALIEDSVPVMNVMNGDGKIVLTQFIIQIPPGRKYRMHASLPGYDDAWLSFEIPENATDQFDAGNLELRKSRNIVLDEVVVTATKVKMFYKGDTIVYDATAFKLPDGSMLDDLIRQLDGVTMNADGEIFVNGRKVDELLLGSRTFLRGNKKVLMENLPYYTVKNLKVYEKQSERSAALGFDVDPKKYVMDVNLKPEYNRGIISNIEAAAGTEDRWLGRGFLLGFAEPYRFTLFGNANNVNESRHIGRDNHWTPASAPKSLLTTYSAAGEFSFRAPNGKTEETLNVDYASTKNESEMRQRKELFLDGRTPLTNVQSTALDKAHTLTVKNLFKFLKPYFLVIGLDYSHTAFSGNSASLQEQFDDTLTNRLRDIGLSDGSRWDFHTQWSGTVSVKKARKAYFNYFFDLRHGRESSERMKGYAFDKPLAAAQNNVNDYRQRKTETLTWLTYSWRTKNDIQFLIDEDFSTTNERTHDWLYHPDTLLLPSERDALLAITDRANSYDSHYTNQNAYTSFTIRKNGLLKPDETMPYPYDYDIWELKLGSAPRHQSLHYQRGALDTLATNTAIAFEPKFSLHLFPTKKYGKEISFSARHTIAAPSLQNRITYRDDSQPLVVKLGNPDLKGNQTTRLTADYFSRGTHQRLFHVGAMFDYLHRATAQSVTYNPTTGVYTYHPENISGNYNVTAKTDFSRALGEKRYWTVKNNADATFLHSIDHAMLAKPEGNELPVLGGSVAELSSHENAVNTLTLHDGASLQYSKGQLNLKATGDIRWRHSEGKMRDFSTLNAFDYQYGMTARYTLPVLKTTISADANMYSRRGYGSANLNTDDFIVNASLSQPFFKGKLIARVEAFDLLHNLSSTQYEVNAQGRTETYYRSLPHPQVLHHQHPPPRRCRHCFCNHKRQSTPNRPEIPRRLQANTETETDKIMYKHNVNGSTLI